MWVELTLNRYWPGRLLKSPEVPFGFAKRASRVFSLLSALAFILEVRKDFRGPFVKKNNKQNKLSSGLLLHPSVVLEGSFLRL